MKMFLKVLVTIKASINLVNAIILKKGMKNKWNSSKAGLYYVK